MCNIWAVHFLHEQLITIYQQPRYGEVLWLFPSHTAAEWQSEALSSGGLTLELLLFNHNVVLILYILISLQIL